MYNLIKSDERTKTLAFLVLLAAWCALGVISMFAGVFVWWFCTAWAGVFLYIIVRACQFNAKETSDLKLTCESCAHCKKYFGFNQHQKFYKCELREFFMFALVPCKYFQKKGAV